jgi:hypothetical protein
MQRKSNGGLEELKLTLASVAYVPTVVTDVWLAVLAGRNVEGVWHTSVVVYEREFFYGGGGVTSCAPVSTRCQYMRWFLGNIHSVFRKAPK